MPVVSKRDRSMGAGRLRRTYSRQGAGIICQRPNMRSANTDQVGSGRSWCGHRCENWRGLGDLQQCAGHRRFYGEHAAPNARKFCPVHCGQRLFRSNSRTISAVQGPAHFRRPQREERRDRRSQQSRNLHALASDCEAVLFVNNDTEFEPFLLEKLAAGMQEHPRT